MSAINLVKWRSWKSHYMSILFTYHSSCSLGLGQKCDFAESHPWLIYFNIHESRKIFIQKLIICLFPVPVYNSFFFIFCYSRLWVGDEGPNLPYKYYIIQGSVIVKIKNSLSTFEKLVLQSFKKMIGGLLAVKNLR